MIEEMTLQEVHEYLFNECDNAKEPRKKFIYRFAAFAVSFQPTQTLDKMWEDFLESERS